ncbi:unnamed protein product [Meganyctiphanes norvegica]|uniref:MBD domain-containing protein n=1 Tax=Meganyctiphanes norvegica TaxID=48144 RepID=A0AAV2Q1F8_MEGNR
MCSVNIDQAELLTVLCSHMAIENMNEVDSSENCDDEFECSDCDFKCTSETAIMQHSVIHQCPNNTNDDVLHIIPYGKYIGEDSKEGDTVVNVQAKFSSEKVILSCDTLTDRPKSNYIEAYKCIVKREPSAFEVLSTTKMLCESDIENKIKVEDLDIDIKQESCPNYSSHQINEFVNNHKDQDSLGSMQYKKEHIYVRESMQSDYNNVNISTEDGNLSAKTIVGESGSLSSQKDPSINDMSLTNSSKGLPPHERPHGHKSSIEVEIDNTGIYIPSGWDRKVYMRTTLADKGQLRYDCYYYTESGKQIRSKKIAYEYANKDQWANVDIEKLNYSISQKTIKPDQPTLEVDLDNTGIYIPEGWQRKVYYNGQRMYHVNYLNAEGRRFGCKSDVYSYISNSDSIKESQIVAEKMDFSRGIKSQLSLKHRNTLDKIEVKFDTTLGKKEVKVDNTGKYIPDGWQRKAYRFTQGGFKRRNKSTIMYISPLGKHLCSKEHVLEYIEKLESNGIMELINVDKMDFWSKN